jgi:hypothetical protein
MASRAVLYVIIRSVYQSRPEVPSTIRRIVNDCRLLFLIRTICWVEKRTARRVCLKEDYLTVDLFGKVSMKDKSNVFTLGDRISILQTQDQIIIPQVAELDNLVLFLGRLRHNA